MSDKSKSTAFLLCYFLGIFGAHRFYVGRLKTGLLMLLTLGGLLIWWLVDSVLIAAGQFKDKDGNPLRSGPPDPDNPAAGFWVRLAAFSVDGVIVQLVLSVILTGMMIVVPLLGVGAFAVLGDMAGGLENMGEEEEAMMGALISAGIGLIAMAIVVVYFAIQHASRHQATIGKRCFDIYVDAGEGSRVGLMRALWRGICYVFSAIPFYLGFVLAGFTRDKRALHDYLSGTRVRYVGEVALDAVSSDVTTVPGMTAGATLPEPASQVAATSTTVEKGGNPGTALMALGALLIAGAAAVALLL
jgi:uncharacterized RDD family membrane protein YckC